MSDHYHIYCPNGKVVGTHSDIYVAERIVRELDDGHYVRIDGRPVSSEELEFLEAIRVTPTFDRSVFCLVQLVSEDDADNQF